MRRSIWLVFVLVCLAGLINDGLANPFSSDSANEEAVAYCGCTAACSDCPYEVRRVQIGRGVIRTQCTCVCHCPSSTPQFPKAPSTPQVPSVPSTPQVPGAPSPQIFLSPACAASSVNVGLCWARSAVGIAFQNLQMAEGCCNMFTQWAGNCFGGNEEIPKLVSYFVPPALVQYCSAHH
ncbi:hypothetical protein P3X46_011673 [Hevea brasiliensis]|uniref:4Fe-4S ferredoxin-type domain-containing protein n=1 Tax=Hevea brasiliensis TaxID=3981 RepID=A0ABQ9M9P7_HEVBR|nr:hypothetical protein P3X46_011673 [Hevea brasiliensis]